MDSWVHALLYEGGAWIQAHRESVQHCAQVSHLAYLSVDSALWRNVWLPSCHGSIRLSNYVHFMALVIRCTGSAVVSFGYMS